MWNSRDSSSTPLPLVCVSESIRSHRWVPGNNPPSYVNRIRYYPTASKGESTRLDPVRAGTIVRPCRGFTGPSPIVNGWVPFSQPSLAPLAHPIMPRVKKKKKIIVYQHYAWWFYTLEITRKKNIVRPQLFNSPILSFRSYNYIGTVALVTTTRGDCGGWGDSSVTILIWQTRVWWMNDLQDLHSTKPISTPCPGRSTHFILRLPHVGFGGRFLSPHLRLESSFSLAPL